MKNTFAFHCCCFASVLFLNAVTVRADINVWTNSASGNWQDASSWSLGVPGTNQTILLTNSGFKVLSIGPETTANFPDSLSVDSITISSPENSANILLMSDAGFQTPLALRDLTVGTNAMMLMYGSSLQTNGETSPFYSIDGTFIQDGGSYVSAPFIFVDGVYQLNSGNLNTTLEFGGSGRFIQSGGTNVSAIGLVSDNGAYEYDLNAGELDGAITIRNAGTFNQSGGLANATDLQIDGGFVQSGGIFNGPTNAVTIPLLLEENPTNAFILQTGGTNREYELMLGAKTPAESDCTFGCFRPQYGGAYTLSNGVLTTYGTTLTANGIFQQFGGTNEISGDLNVGGSIYYVAGGGPAFTGPLGVDYANRAKYSVNGGFLSADNIRLGVAGSLVQSGGEVAIAGTLSLGGPSLSNSGRWYSGSYTLHGGTLSAPVIWMSLGSGLNEGDGFLAASNVTVGAGTFTQEGGTNVITGGLLVQSSTVSDSCGECGTYELTTYTGSYQLNRGSLVVSNLALVSLGQFSQSGGRLTASDMQLAGGMFLQSGGNIIQSGLLIFDNASWYSAAGTQQLGQLRLAQTNSICLPTSSCTLQFRDSSSSVWSNTAILAIQNWSGSLYGGGNQQIIFGNNSAALTPQQLSQIQFQNPAGLSSGNYPARILATGEIVPDTGASLPLKFAITFCPTNSAMQLNLCGDIGQSYDIEVSTDLVNWTWWTNEFNSNGTIYLNDSDATHYYSQRFYRTRPTP